MKRTKNIAIAALLVLVIIVVFQNTETVETKILFITMAMPRALLLFLTLLVGIVLGLLYSKKKPGFTKKEPQP